MKTSAQKVHTVRVVTQSVAAKTVIVIHKRVAVPVNRAGLEQFVPIDVTQEHMDLIAAKCVSALMALPVIILSVSVSAPLDLRDQLVWIAAPVIRLASTVLSIVSARTALPAIQQLDFVIARRDGPVLIVRNVYALLTCMVKDAKILASVM